MAQTTTAMSQANFEVEVSNDGTSWTSIAGQATTVSLSGGEQKIGSQHTADGEQAVVVGANKVEPITVTVKTLYTETSAEAWKLVKARYDGTAKTIFLRYSPGGGDSGDLRYSCAVGGAAALVPIVSCLPPDMDAGAEDLAMFEFAVMTPGLLEATISS